MDTTRDVSQLPSRPAPVTFGAAMLLGSAVALVATWLLGIDVVESNGARVFFVVLWGFLAWSAYSGVGWVRGATVAILVIAILGFVNAPSFVDAVRGMPLGDGVAKVLALLSLGALWSPAANRWFAAVRQTRTGG